MSEKRTLSESSGDEADVPENKSAKLDVALVRDVPNAVTEAAGDNSDSGSSSDSSSSTDSSSSSDSSDSESSADEEKPTKEEKSLKDIPNVSQATNLNQEASDLPGSADISNMNDSDINSTKESNKNSQSYSSTTVAKPAASLSGKNSQDILNNSTQGMSIDGADDTGGEFSLDEFQQFLQVDDEGSGPVDPVFVDHEDSQHAAHLDTLVFDSENETDQAVDSLPGLNDDIELNAANTVGVLGVGKTVDLNFIGKRKDTFAENVENNHFKNQDENMINYATTEKEYFNDESKLNEFSDTEEGEIFSSPSIPATPGGVINSPSFKGSGAVLGRNFGGITPLEENRNDPTSHSKENQPGAAVSRVETPGVAAPRVETPGVAAPRESDAVSRVEMKVTESAAAVSRVETKVTESAVVVSRVETKVRESDAITDGETDSESAQPPRKKKKTKKRKKRTKDTNEKLKINNKEEKTANNCDDKAPKYRSKCHDSVVNTSKISHSMHSKSSIESEDETNKETYPSQLSNHAKSKELMSNNQQQISQNELLANSKDSKSQSSLSVQNRNEDPSLQSKLNQKVKKPKQNTASTPPSTCPYKLFFDKLSPKPSNHPSKPSQDDHKNEPSQDVHKNKPSQDDHKNKPSKSPSNQPPPPPLPATPPKRTQPALPPQPSLSVVSSPSTNPSQIVSSPSSNPSKQSSQKPSKQQPRPSLLNTLSPSAKSSKHPNSIPIKSPTEKTPENAFSQEKSSTAENKGTSDTESKPGSPETSSLSPPHHGTSPKGSGGKSKKLSLKDYKAKKEAEKQRKLETGESGSECSSAPSSKTTSRVNSKEPSPEKMDVTGDLNYLDQVSDVDMEERLNSDNVVEEGEEIMLMSGSSLSLYQSEDVDVNLYPSEEPDGLDGFDILDELDPQESDTYSNSGDESDVSLGEEEVHALLEEAVPRPVKEKPAPIPHEKHTKLVLDERGQNVFEVLPLGWVTVTHNSGIPLYLQRETRVISTTRPYNLGAGSVRKHSIPISAIPCYNYRYYSKLDGKSNSSNATSATTPSQSAPPTLNEASSHSSVASSHTSVPAQTCPIAQSRSLASASTGSSDFCKDSVSPDSTTDAEKQSSEVPMAEPVAEAAAVPETSTIFPKAKIETIEDNLKETSLSAEDVHKYCSNLFVFKELEVTKFKSWKDRRSYTKEQNKMRLVRQLAARPTLPEGTKVITIPTVELASMDGTDGENAMDQTVVKKSKKEWIINPVGKSMVCLLHEYIQQSLKKQPAYKFTELDNANSPYAATVIVNGMEYGKGVGSSKKIAKSEAARKTLEILIPEIKDKLPQMKKTEETEGPDLSFFDDVRIEDPRVSDLCNRTSEPSPYIILVTCLQRNYGLGDTHITQELNMKRNQKNEYTMRVNKREVSVICKNKKDGKQLAAQKLLQQLHPHITSWGSLLRMYGNRSIRQFKQKKEKETEVTGLQTRGGNSTQAPSLVILDKLREEMRNLREIKKNAMPLGKFQPPSGLKTTGLNTDHVNL